ncbi:MAG: GNAT family N-acetyltransferase [Candidatus Odinarchaeota archaeon]
MASQKDIAELEYLASLCWPAREVERYKGWIIHWNDGITWRANSVLPLESHNEIELEEAIEHIITFYDKRKTPPAFKITEASLPKNLDETLADMGFEKRMVTNVQIIQIDELSCIYPRVPVDIIKVNNESINSLMFKSGLDEIAIKVRKEIINRIEGEKGIARVLIDGKLAGVGLGVVQESWLGIFSIRTLPEYRRRGVAWSVNCAIGLWGEDLGAKNAFLQVEANNAPALAFYESMGFETMYTYWYRILDHDRK